MTDDESKMIKDVHDFLFKPAVPGGDVTRAKQIEDLLNAAKSGKLIARAMLWTAAAIVGLGSAWVMLKELLVK